MLGVGALVEETHEDEDEDEDEDDPANTIGRAATSTATQKACDRIVVWPAPLCMCTRKSASSATGAEKRRDAIFGAHATPAPARVRASRRTKPATGM